MRFRRFEVVENSMRPTLEPGDYLLGQTGTQPRRFDIVAFEHPSRTGFWMVKRVVGLGEETIDLDRGTIDGQQTSDPYRDELVDSGVWEIPPYSMFVLSDDRAITRSDSRTIGPVPIAGSYRIRLRYWPIGSIRLL